MLDPRNPGERTARALSLWLSLHATFGYRPGEARAAFEAGLPPEDLLAHAGVAPLAIPAVDRARRRLVRAGARLVPYPAADYPAPLRRLEDAPPLLFLRGSLPEAGRWAAVVGARAATAYGRGVARRLGRALGEARIPVVSGLARGIDGECHRGVLEAGGSGVAILAHGIDRLYPPEHRRLADALSRSGALLSEFAPGAPPLPGHFPVRNRVIAALSEIVVVVEARRASGSLVTARHALDQGRDVWAVPGPITAATSTGTNALLRDGATPLVEIDDLLDALGASARAGKREDERDPILRALREEPLSRDELASLLGLDAAGLAARLVPLELEGRVLEDRDGRLRAP